MDRVHLGVLISDTASIGLGNAVGPVQSLGRSATAVDYQALGNSRQVVTAAARLVQTLPMVLGNKYCIGFTKANG